MTIRSFFLCCHFVGVVVERASNISMRKWAFFSIIEETFSILLCMSYVKKERRKITKGIGNDLFLSRFYIDPIRLDLYCVYQYQLIHVFDSLYIFSILISIATQLKSIIKKIQDDFYNKYVWLGKKITHFFFLFVNINIKVWFQL